MARDISAYDPTNHMGTAEFSKRTGVSIRTLKRWRVEGILCGDIIDPIANRHLYHTSQVMYAQCLVQPKGPGRGKRKKKKV